MCTCIDDIQVFEHPGARVLAEVARPCCDVTGPHAVTVALDNVQGVRLVACGVSHFTGVDTFTLVARGVVATAVAGADDVNDVISGTCECDCLVLAGLLGKLRDDCGSGRRRDVLEFAY